jgi:hypothetical protein
VDVHIVSSSDNSGDGKKKHKDAHTSPTRKTTSIREIVVEMPEGYTIESASSTSTSFKSVLRS